LEQCQDGRAVRLGRRLRTNEEYRIAVVSKGAGVLFLDAIHDQKISMTALVVR
jgi:hypothetical protein